MTDQDLSPFPNDSEALPDPVDLLPQAGPMNLIDEGVEHESNRTVCRFTVRENDVLLKNGGIPAWFGIEHMGQCSFYHYLVKTQDESWSDRQALFLGVRHMSFSVQQLDLHSSYLVTARDFGVHDRYYSTDNCLLDEETGDTLMEGRLSALILEEEESLDDPDLDASFQSMRLR